MLWSAVLTHLDRSEIVDIRVKMMIIRFKDGVHPGFINFQFERHSLQEAITNAYHLDDKETFGVKTNKKNVSFWNQG